MLPVAVMSLVMVISSQSVFGQTVTVSTDILTVLRCGNPWSGVCRLQCQTGEFSVYPFLCSLNTVVLGQTYQRCVTAMPCCYWTGTCQPTCTNTQIQLSSAATCSNAADACCVPTSRVNNGTTASTSTTLSTTTTTTTAATTTTTSSGTVVSRQGVCGRTTRLQPRIIGGRVAGALDWPWMVRLTYTQSSGFCGAVLVNRNTVVTAAHCVAGVAARTMRVILADYDLSTFDRDQEVVNVASYAVVNGFQRGIRGRDFAVLKLSRNIQFTDRKLPACLYDPTIPLVSPAQCYIAGWGVSEQGLGGPIRATNLKLLSRATCAQRLTALQGSTVSLPADILCTDNSAIAPSDGCSFDDGDMLVCLDTKSRWSLVGVLSEYSCGSNRGLPALFTDVRTYTNFILSRL